MNGVTDRQFGSGETQKEVIRSVMGDLPNVKTGAIGDYPGTLARANSYSGNTTGILRELTGGGFFIDNGKANALGTDEYIDQGGDVLVINAKSGLLGTPILEQTIVRFDMIFEPAITTGTKVKLESLTEENFSGYYKVTGVKHRGMISDAVCGSVITTGEFFYTKILTGVEP